MSLFNCNLTVSEFERQAEAERGCLLPADPVFDPLTLPTMQQAALMQMHESQIKRAIIARLTEDSQDLPRAPDYAALRELGFAERRPADRWHNLTYSGRTVANDLQRALCRKFNIHLLIEGSPAGWQVSYRCPCGWSTSVRRSHTAPGNGRAAFNRHIATAEGMSKLVVALKPRQVEG